MANPYRIRAAEPADLAAVHAIEREVFSDPWPLESFLAELDGVALVAVSEEAVLGYAFARAAADEGELRNLAIHNAHRRRGLGARLVEAVVGRLAAAGVRTLYLEVRPSNATARTFYRQLGFIEVGRRRRYYRRPVEDALILARLIPALSPPA